MYREYLQKMIGFDKWHLNSLNERFYASPTINRINEMLRSENSTGIVIEVGCGLGDIISAVRWRYKMGYDIDKRAIWAARMLHPLTPFRAGTFDALRNKKIAVLIALNFLHRVSAEDCRRYFGDLFHHNQIEIIVVDVVQSPPYQYKHDYEKLFGEFGYTLEYQSRGYIAYKRSIRKILYFRRRGSFKKAAGK